MPAEAWVERARPATPSRPRVTMSPPTTGPRSARCTTSGSRSDERSKTPARDAVRNAATISRCRRRSAAPGFGAPWTRRRPRLACCRTAVRHRPTLSTSSSNGTASCRAARASRSAVVSVSDHASPVDGVAHEASCSVDGVGVTDAVRRPVLARLLAAYAPALQHVEAHPGDDGGEPASEVVDGLRIGAVQAQPGLLQRVVALRRRSEDAVGDRSQARSVRLELPGQVRRVRCSRLRGVVLGHPSHSPFGTGQRGVGRPGIG